MPPELSGTTAILMVFQADSGHEKITDIYVGLVVRQVDSRLYSRSQIPDFIQDIEGNLRAACNALKARRDPGKRHAYCLFVDNLSGIMSIPTDPITWCIPPDTSKASNLIILTLVTCPVGTCLHHCVCHATLQFSNDDPKLRTQYIGSHRTTTEC